MHKKFFVFTKNNDTLPKFVVINSRRSIRAERAVRAVRAERAVKAERAERAGKAESAEKAVREERAVEYLCYREHAVPPGL